MLGIKDDTHFHCNMKKKNGDATSNQDYDATDQELCSKKGQEWMASTKIS